MKLVFLVLVLFVVLSIAFAKAKKNSNRRSVSKDIDDEEEVTFSNEAELEAKIEQIKNKRQKESDFDDSLSESELKEFKEMEKELRKGVLRAELEHGEFSNERAKALHALGANMFRQHRFEELFELSHQILRIHETLDGYDSVMAGKAWGNVGTVAHRLGRHRECELAMKRCLYIMLNAGGVAPDSREVLMHRGKMLTFHVADGETTQGLSYSDYVNILEDEL